MTGCEGGAIEGEGAVVEEVMCRTGSEAAQAVHGPAPEAAAALVPHPRLMLRRRLAAAADVAERREPHWMDLAVVE